MECASLEDMGGSRVFVCVYVCRTHINRPDNLLIQPCSTEGVCLCVSDAAELLRGA